MAVRPVTPTNFSVNTRNDITFSGRKDENHKHSTNLRSSAMAVPLATLIAMSPLNTQSANRLEFNTKPAEKTELVSNASSQQEKIISSKEFKLRYGNMTINAISTDGNSNNFEKIQIELFEHGENSILEMTELAKLDYSIVGDDGKAVNVKLDLYSMKMKGIEGLLKGKTKSSTINEITAAYLKSLLDSPKNNTNIVQETYTNKLRPTSEDQLQNVPNGNIIKNASPYKCALKNIGQQDFEGSNGTYTFRYFTFDKNEDDMELLTITPPGGPELACLGTYTNTAYFRTAEGDREIKYETIKLMDHDDNEYVICDEDISAWLYYITQQDGFNGGYEVKKIWPVEYYLSPKGVVAPVERVEDKDLLDPELIDPAIYELLQMLKPFL